MTDEGLLSMASRVDRPDVCFATPYGSSLRRPAVLKYVRVEGQEYATLHSRLTLLNLEFYVGDIF